MALVSTGDMPSDFRWRGRFRAYRGGQAGTGIDVSAALEGGALTVVARAPTGFKLLEVRQRGTAYDVLHRGPRSKTAPPEWVLDALHRLIFIQPPAELKDFGQPAWNHHGEQVEQRGYPERPYSRTYAREGELERVLIDYGSLAPLSATIGNPWCGYLARLRQLPPPNEKKRRSWW